MDENMKLSGYIENHFNIHYAFNLGVLLLSFQLNHLYIVIRSVIIPNDVWNQAVAR